MPRPWQVAMVAALAAIVLMTDGAAARKRPRRIGGPASMAPYRGDPSSYYQLPFRGYLDPGTAEILRPRCDDSYPLHESMPCDTATGGPVGGLGS